MIPRCSLFCRWYCGMLAFTSPMSAYWNGKIGLTYDLVLKLDSATEKNIRGAGIFNTVDMSLPPAAPFR